MSDRGCKIPEEHVVRNGGCDAILRSRPANLGTTARFVYREGTLKRVLEDSPNDLAIPNPIMIFKFLCNIYKEGHFKTVVSCVIPDP